MRSKGFEKLQHNTKNPKDHVCMFKKDMRRPYILPLTDLQAMHKQEVKAKTKL